MADTSTRERILDATIQLLINSDYASSITARQIASAAEVNLAMINYCFHSKDKLIVAAVDRIVEESFHTAIHSIPQGEDSKTQLQILLCTISDEVYKYRKVTKLSIPYLLLQEKILVPEKILPLLKKCMGSKSEVENKIIAYQMISFFQLVFIQEKNFKEYTGINIENKEERHRLIEFQIELLCKS